MVLPYFRAVGIDIRLVFSALVTFREELDGAGMVHAERPLDDVEVVGAPVAILAGAVVPEAAPAAAVIAFDPSLVVWIPGGRAEPAVVIKALWNGFLGQRLRRGGLAQVPGQGVVFFG